MVLATWLPMQIEEDVKKRSATADATNADQG